jgi:hypothetical protein
VIVLYSVVLDTGYSYRHTGLVSVCLFLQGFLIPYQDPIIDQAIGLQTRMTPEDVCAMYIFGTITNLVGPERTRERYVSNVGGWTIKPKCILVSIYFERLPWRWRPQCVICCLARTPHDWWRHCSSICKSTWPRCSDAEIRVKFVMPEVGWCRVLCFTICLATRSVESDGERIQCSFLAGRQIVNNKQSHISIIMPFRKACTVSTGVTPKIPQMRSVIGA